MDVKDLTHSNDEPKVVKTDVGAKDGQNKCPKCGATDISTNAKTGKLRCNFCRHEFEPEKIILGCTHYPYLMNELQKYAPKELFLNPAGIFVDFIKDDLQKCGLLTGASGTEEIYVSAEPESFVQHSRIFYDVKSLPQIINLTF